MVNVFWIPITCFENSKDLPSVSIPIIARRMYSKRISETILIPFQITRHNSDCFTNAWNPQQLFQIIERSSVSKRTWGDQTSFSTYRFSTIDHSRLLGVAWRVLIIHGHTWTHDIPPSPESHLCRWQPPTQTITDSFNSTSSSCGTAL